MKQLVVWVFGAVAGTLLGSCVIGVASVELGGRDAVTIGRDLGIFVIALMTWISAVIGFAIWFGLAAGTGAATNAMVRGLRWVGKKAGDADEATARGLERYVVRPFAIGVGYATTGATARALAAAKVGHLRAAAIGVARDAFGQTSSVIASLRPRGKVVIRTGVSAPHDLP